MRNSWCWLCAAVLLAAVSDAVAQPPAPLDVTRLYSFPGAHAGPGSAVSAGVALADRWLGDEPFENPAVAPVRGIMLAPVLQRVKRQDLPGDFRSYDETAGYLDLAGGWLSLPVRGTAVTLYAFQPVLRLEDQAFTTKPDEVPGTFTSAASARELRAGLALSRPLGDGRLGAAVEWTRREDSYDFDEVSGSPLAGLRHVDFAGDGLGFQVGASQPVGPVVVLGCGLRYVPALDLTGRRTSEAGSLAEDVSATREARWDGGVSARWGVSDAVRVLASLGGRTGQEWAGFGVSTGSALSWSAGFEYEEPEQPWTFRFGYGHEQQPGTPEPRAGMFALGVGWTSESLRLDVGALRRAFERGREADSYDDRVVASLTVGF